MKVEILYSRNDWVAVLNACRTTVGKEQIYKEPKAKWKKNLLLAEHSPIRKLHIGWKWSDLRYKSKFIRWLYKLYYKTSS